MQKYRSKTVVVVYGGLGETHESAFVIPGNNSAGIKVVQGAAIRATSSKSDIVTLNYKLTSTQTVVLIGNRLQVIIVNRNAASNFWVPDIDNSTVIVQGPDLIRSAGFTGNSSIVLRGDLNQTKTDAELIADDFVTSVSVNGRTLATRRTSYGSLRFILSTGDLSVTLPAVEQLQWVL